MENHEPDENHIILNGKLKPGDRPYVSISSRAVSYGDGCFETFRSYQGKFLALDQHVKRLNGALNYLGMKTKFEISEEKIRKESTELLQENHLDDKQALVRIQCWREGKRGYHTSADNPVSYAVSVSPLPDIPKSITLAKVETRRIPASALNPSYKLSNGINYIRARREASEQNADDALMLNTRGFISETTIANIFWIKNQHVFTPNIECDILPGITRGIFNNLVRLESNKTIIKGKFTISDIENAEAAFICNSLREMVPVRSLDNVDFDPDHAFIQVLKKLYEVYRDQHLT